MAFQALVLGASGITGWAITNSALTYPTPSTFSRVVGVTSRPLAHEAALLPADPKLELVSGLELSQDAATIVKFLKTIKDIEQITHVYFAAYVHRGWGAEDAEARRQENVDFIVNAILVIEAVCPAFQFLSFPTGGKWYGFEYGTTVPRTLPVRESHPRIPPPLGNNIFYYPQIDALTALSQNKTWTFADIRPDAIVGFVPNHNAMNIAEPLALYISLWKDKNPGMAVPFPGSKESWRTVHSNCSQDQLARFSIFVSLRPEVTAGKAYNIADVDYGVSWEMVWPGIVGCFEVEATGPIEGEVVGEEWARSHKAEWSDWEKENGLREGVLEKTCWGFMTIVTGEFSTFDRNYDLGEARKLGFVENVDPVAGYRIAFDRMMAAKIIPDLSAGN